MLLDYIFFLSSLGAGFVLGLGSRFVIKQTLKDYIDDRMKDVTTVTNNYTTQVQLQCDKIVDEAQSKAILIYKEALQEASEVAFKFEEKDLN